jgi:predicted transcriptional regulator
MRKKSELTPAEYAVMDALWQLGEGTVKEVLAVMSGERALAYTTIATLLTRLREKGIVAAEERNFAYVFRPLRTREAIAQRELDELVQTMFAGDLGPLAVYIAENRNLTPEQQRQLQEIVDGGEEEG